MNVVEEEMQRVTQKTSAGHVTERNQTVKQHLLTGKMRLSEFSKRWEARRLDEIISIRNQKISPSCVDSDTLYVELDHIDSGSGKLIKYSNSSSSTSTKYRFFTGDVLFGRLRSYLRKFWRADRDGICTTEIWPLIANTEQIECDFLYLIVQTNLFIETAGISYGTHMPRADWSVMQNLEIQLPPITEQRAIVEALSDVDCLIQSLEALIAKKQSIKQATMQQLLTGKTRLPGFRGEWQMKQLGKLGRFLKGRGIKREDVSSTGFPCIRYGELYTRYENYILNAVARVPSYVAQIALPIKTGDLLFAGSGETSEEIGRCAAYLGDEPAYAGGDIVVLTPLEQNSLYLGYLMNQPAAVKQKAQLGQGDAVVHINARNLAQIEINLPLVEEQTAIAAVLFDMDAEIAALEQRRDKTRALKQGMMQQLLTGKIRLIESVQTTTRQASATSTGKGHNWQINEAVVISVLAERFGNEEYPLSRMRYTKLLYLLHRHVEGHAEGYLKKAAGPYNPRTRYGGPEKIALKNHYVRRHGNGSYRGFIAGENIEKAEGYFSRWYGEDCLKWLDQFRYERSGDLELLTTVDLAAEELREAGKGISVESVREAIRGDPEWQAKLKRSIFSDANISRAIDKCRTLFDPGHERPKP